MSGSNGKGRPDTAKPLTLSADWIEYAHRPGADSAQPAALELCRLPESSGRVRIPDEREDLVDEIIQVAQLYSGGLLVDQEDRIRSARATRVIKRCRAWLDSRRSSAPPSVKVRIRITAAMIREYRDRELFDRPFNRFIEPREYEMTEAEAVSLQGDAEYQGDVAGCSGIEGHPPSVKAMYRRLYAALVREIATAKSKR